MSCCGAGKHLVQLNDIFIHVEEFFFFGVNLLSFFCNLNRKSIVKYKANWCLTVSRDQFDYSTMAEWFFCDSLSLSFFFFLLKNNRLTIIITFLLVFGDFDTHKNKPAECDSMQICKNIKKSSLERKKETN